MVLRHDPPFLRPDLDILTSVAAPVRDLRGDVQDAVERMLHLIRRSGHAALAGPHVGYRRRVVVVDVSRTGRGAVVLINPEVESVSRETQVDAERCSVLPGLAVELARPVHLVVRGRARSGQPVRIHVEGLTGRILQHQLDHLDGRLLLDHMTTEGRAGARARATETPGCALAR